MSAENVQHVKSELLKMLQKLELHESPFYKLVEKCVRQFYVQNIDKTRWD